MLTIPLVQGDYQKRATTTRDSYGNASHRHMLGINMRDYQNGRRRMRACGGGTILARVYVTHGRACIPGCVRHHVRQEQDGTRRPYGKVEHWPDGQGWPL